MKSNRLSLVPRGYIFSSAWLPGVGSCVDRGGAARTESSAGQCELCSLFENEVLPEPATGGLPEMPLSFRITMWGDQGQILWREVIYHHES